jgi:hypothetical protein
MYKPIRFILAFTWGGKEGKIISYHNNIKSFLFIKPSLRERLMSRWFFMVFVGDLAVRRHHI